MKNKSGYDIAEINDLETKMDAFTKVILHLQLDDGLYIKIIREVLGLNPAQMSEKSGDEDIPFHEASEAPTEVTLQQLDFDADK